MGKPAALIFLLTAACAVRVPEVRIPQGDANQPHASFRDVDDGPHPSDEPAYFEWWYFDATFDDGTSATLALYASAMFSRHGKPAVLINLLDPSGQARSGYRTAAHDALAFGKHPGEVTVADASIARTDDGALRIRVSGEGAQGEPLAADLTFHGTMPGFKLGDDGALRFDGKVALGWVVPMPRARVDGTLQVGNLTWSVRGLGYHDHNWGEINLIDTISYWYWGRVASPDMTLVYASIHFREDLGLPAAHLAVVGDDRRFVRTLVDSKVSPLEEEFLEAANRNIPKGVDIDAPGIHARLQGSKVLSAEDLVTYLPLPLRPLVRMRTHPAYVRRLCDYSVDAHLAGIPSTSRGQAIGEFMYVRAP
jgi:predicted secreted hydrolase